VNSTQVRWVETLLASHGAKSLRGFILISANESDVPMEFSVRQASSCDQSDWSEKEAAKTPWKPVVVFGRSNNTGIDPTRDPHKENKSGEHRHECFHCTRAIVHINAITSL